MSTSAVDWLRENGDGPRRFAGKRAGNSEMQDFYEDGHRNFTGAGRKSSRRRGNRTNTTGRRRAAGRRRRRRDRRSRRQAAILLRVLCALVLLAAGAGLCTLLFFGVRRFLPLVTGGAADEEDTVQEEILPQTPEETLAYYIDCISAGEYGTMYEMLAPQSRAQIGRDAFIDRNRNIYEGISAENLSVEVTQTGEGENGAQTVLYQMSMGTAAGEISFSHEAVFVPNRTEEQDEAGGSASVPVPERQDSADSGADVPESGADSAGLPVSAGSASGSAGQPAAQQSAPYPYLLLWDDSMIFSSLRTSDKVQVRRDNAQRGEILDRNGVLLAGKGVASSVGLVPGKMETEETLAASASMEGALVYEDTEGGISADTGASKVESGAAVEAERVTAASAGTSGTEDTSVSRLAAALGVSEESIEQKLSAAWVKEDSFVPVRTIAKLTDQEAAQENPDEETREKIALEEELLEIPGVMITDTEVRDYPLGKAAAHLTGYVQQVTAEDLENHPGEGYRADSVIGRSGMETLYEKELKGQDGCKIVIVDENGEDKEVLAQISRRDGETIRLTIDARLQQALYETYAEDESCSVVMNPSTGEVLALVSTPSFDSRDFVYGMPQSLWDSLNEDQRQPLYNRFRQTLAPGSSFKPIVAAIGIDNGSIVPDEDYGPSALRWQQDESWGGYYVTTLHTYEPVTLSNALVYSDNIYFAKAALRMGEEAFVQGMEKLGFAGEIPFEIALTPSQYSNDGAQMTQIQLADSGYGQGQMLVNPVHLAALYTGFVNNGDVIRPYLRYREDAAGEVWISQAYSREAAQRVYEGMRQVIADPNGTGHAANRADLTLAGKTGTAEIKQSVDDTDGTELGWFCVMSEATQEREPFLLVTMVEDVKERGGSGYVVSHTNAVLERWLENTEGEVQRDP
ncbi:MAG: penicillin-binding transpeptidase domain-containing protein [Eubacteriales bacterium]|nr:penicillin-binding transpeptidase domain-containing protein [Eubacteriales bacterium]